MATARTKLDGIPLTGMKLKIFNATKGQYTTSSKKLPIPTKNPPSKA